VQDTRWEPFGTGFPQYTWATCLAYGNGVLWSGTGNEDRTLSDFGRGLAGLSGETWSLDPVPGMPGSSCYQILIEDGLLYLGSHNRGLMAQYPSGWEQFDQESGMPNVLRTYSVVPAQGGGIWTASYHHGLTWIDDSGTASQSDDSLVTFAADSLADVPPGFPQVLVPLLNNQVVSLARQGDCLWIGQESFWQTPDEPSGIVAAVGSPATGSIGWAQYTEATGLASRNVRAVYASSDGTIWIAFAGEGGCQQLDYAGTPLDPSDDKWYPGYKTAYTSASGLPSNQVFCFSAGPGGSVAIGTGAGLCTIAPDGKVSVVAGVEGTVKAIAADTSGRLWCLGTTSIWCCDGDEVTVLDAFNSPFIPTSRVEGEFGWWDPVGGDVYFSSIAGLWKLGVSGGLYERGSPVFYPQPFVPAADGYVRLAGISAEQVSVRIFSLDGRFLTEIRAGSAPEWIWDGTVDGAPVASGVYMALIRAGTSSWACRMAVVR
jgi:hypothetical protein